MDLAILALAVLAILVAIQLNRNATKENVRLFRSNKKLERQNPFKIYDSSELDVLATDLPLLSEIPYQDRRPADIRHHLGTRLVTENSLLVGRRGLGKTREALELIHRKCVHYGEQTTILYLRDEFVDVPLRSSWLGHGRYGILLVDNVDKFMSQPSVDEVDSPLERIGRVISDLNGHFDRLDVVFTSRDENWSEIKRIINWPNGFWAELGVQKYQLSGIHKTQRPGFIKAALNHFGLDASEREISQIASAWDGTGEAVISAFRRFSHGETTAGGLSQLSYTYPGNWRNEVYEELIQPGSDQEMIFKSLALLNRFHILPYDFLVIRVAAAMRSGYFYFLRLATMRRALSELSSWMFLAGNIVVCPRAYLEEIDVSDISQQALLRGFQKSWSNRDNAQLLQPYLQRFQQIKPSNDLTSRAIISFYRKLVRHSCGQEIDLAIATLLARSGQKLKARNFVKKLKFDVDTLGQRGAVYAGRVLEENGRGLEATELFKSAHAKWPSSEPVSISYAVSLNKRNQPKRAVEVLSEIAKLHTSSFQLQVTLGRVLEAVGEIPKALLHFERALTLNPNSTPAAHAFAICLERAGQHKKAAAYFEQVTNDDVDDLSVLISVAANYFNCDELNKAAVAVTKALEAIDDDPDKLRYFANVLGFSHNEAGVQRAVEIMDYVVKLRGNANDWSVLSNLYTSQRNYADGTTAARRATELDPESKEVKNSLAFNLKFSDQDDDMHEVIEIYSTLANDSDDVKDWVNLSEAYIKDRQRAKGVISARRAMELDPESSEAQKVLDFATKVETPTYLNFLGSEQRKKGDLESALKTYLKSIELAGSTGPAYYGLGLTYLDLGDVSSAINAFKKAPKHKKSQQQLINLNH